MDLDLDTLAALAEQAPGEPLSARTMALPATVAFYRAMREAAPALIAAAREREALAARVGELDRALTETFTNAQRVAEQRDATCAELREVYSVHGELAHEGLRRLRAAVAADDRYHALARAVRAQASATGTPVSADVARLLEEVGDGAE